MFDLIEQAELYPSFLPWCTSAEILERSDDWVAARLEFSYLSVRFTMRTRNPKRRPEWLQVRMVEGPFKQFHGDWRLVPLADQGCKVSFDLSYQFSEGLVDQVAKAALELGYSVRSWKRSSSAPRRPCRRSSPRFRRLERASDRSAARLGHAACAALSSSARGHRPRLVGVAQQRRLAAAARDEVAHLGRAPGVRDRRATRRRASRGAGRPARTAAR